MKIVFLVGKASLGGVQIRRFHLFEKLVSQGFDIILFSLEDGPLIGSLSKLSHDRCVTGSMADFLVLLDKVKPNVVHISSQELEVGAGCVKHIFPEIKIIVSIHGAIPAGWTKKNCDTLVAISNWLVKPSEIISKMPVTRIYNGIDLNKFKIKSTSTGGQPILLWVGRANDMIKRIEILGNIAKDLHQNKIRIWVVSPCEACDVKHFNISEKLEPYVELWTHSKQSDMPNIYQRVASSGGSLLMTSLREGLPSVSTEAQACGCPLIGVNVRGINETTSPDDASILFHENIAKEELVSLIVKRLNQKDKQIKRGIDSSTYISEKFSLENIAQQYIDVYKGNNDKSSVNIPFLTNLKSLLTWIRYYYLEERPKIKKSINLIRNDLNEKGKLALLKRLNHKINKVF